MLEIKNPYLRYICCYHEEAANPFVGVRDFPGLPGGKSSIAGVLFIYIVQIAYGVHRFPGYADRLLSKDGSDAVEKISRWFSSEPKAYEIIESCVDDLLRVYRCQLKYYHNNNIDYLTLYRNIGWTKNGNINSELYPYIVKHVIDSALKNNIGSVKLDMDTVSHWTNDILAYDHGENNIKLTRIIPVQDIIFNSSLVAGMETNEFLVLSRSPKGYMDIAPGDVIIRGFQDSKIDVRGVEFPQRFSTTIPVILREDVSFQITDNRNNLSNVTFKQLLMDRIKYVFYK